MKNILILFFLVPLTILSQSEKAKKYTYVALGDSYTIGESVKESKRWPVQLYKSLKGKLVYPEIIAKTGWTTDELIDTLNRTEFKNYDFVSLLIGVNNQYRGSSIESFKKDFIELLNKSILYAKKKKERVFVVSIPDWGVTPFAKDRDRKTIKNEINAFNKIIIDQCKINNITYYDITKNSRKAKYDKSLIAKDGLHPSKKMYKQWVKIIKPHFNNF